MRQLVRARIPHRSEVQASERATGANDDRAAAFIAREADAEIAGRPFGAACLRRREISSANLGRFRETEFKVKNSFDRP